jgi:Transcriptional activator TraM
MEEHEEKFRETIREIAARHQVAVGKDDPILILHTMNELLLRDSAKVQREILEAFKEEIEMIAFRWKDDAKQKAERMLQVALNASKDAMAAEMAEASKVFSDKVRSEAESIVDRLDKSVYQARQIAIFNIVASALIAITVGFMLIQYP